MKNNSAGQGLQMIIGVTCSLCAVELFVQLSNYIYHH